MKKTTLLFLVFAGFFGAQNVNAAIVYNNGADQTLASGGSLTIDFNNDGTPEYTFQDMGFGGAVQPGIMFATANHHLTTVSTGEWDVIQGLAAGTTINGTAGFFDMGDAYVDPGWATTMFPTTDTYIGAKFRIGASDYFGWILVNWNANGTFIVKSFAYESTPSTAINAGATGQSASLSENSAVDFELYPNPATEFVQISLPLSVNCQVEFFSLSGKLENSTVFSASMQAISVSELPKGTYIVRVSTNNDVEEKLFVKE